MPIYITSDLSIVRLPQKNALKEEIIVCCTQID